MPNQPGVLPQRPPRLLEVAREKMRTRHLSLRTEHAYLQWLRRYVAFHAPRHPRELGAAGVEAFLTHLAVKRKVSAATQSQALQALLFLYRQVLEIRLPWLGNVTRATQPKRLPVVLDRAEVRSLLAQLQGAPWLMASLLYGSGLRLTEGLRLRVKDLALERGELIVRDGKGGRDRLTMLPQALHLPLRAHLERLREWFEEERRRACARRHAAACAGAQVPAGRRAVGLAVPVPRRGTVPRSVLGPAAAASPAREGRAARGAGRGAAGGPVTAGQLPHAAALLRHAPARGRLRRPHPAGAARALGPEDHHDLHARAVEGRGRGAQSARPYRSAQPRPTAGAPAAQK